MRTVRPETAHKALAMTAAFEGGGRLAGNFDGQLLSWGPLQWNVGKGTLLPLLKRVAELEPRTRDLMGEPFVAALASNDRARRVLPERGAGRLWHPQARVGGAVRVPRRYGRR